MAEQGQLVVRHRRRRGSRQRAREGKVLADSELVQPLPAVERQELVIGRRADRAPEPGRQAKDGLAAGGERAHAFAPLELPGLSVQGHDAEARRAHELPNRSVHPDVRQVDAGVTGDAAGLAKVRQHRNRGVARLDGA
jgi:hypothetical protein